MRKVLIFGNSGSGKSTLAKKLAIENDLVHFDLDQIAWLPTIPPERETIENSKRKLDDFVDSNDYWVVEGCYADLLGLITPVATEMIFLNLSIAQCVENARSRPWEPHKYKSKEEQDKSLEMLINWIEDYHNRKDVFSYAAHQALFDNFTGKKRMLTDNGSYI